MTEQEKSRAKYVLRELEEGSEAFGTFLCAFGGTELMNSAEEEDLIVLSEKAVGYVQGFKALLRLLEGANEGD